MDETFPILCLLSEYEFLRLLMIRKIRIALTNLSSFGHMEEQELQNIKRDLLDL